MDNRVLKFRAWDKFNDCYHYQQSESLAGLFLFFKMIADYKAGGNEIIVERFTGLHDKNGKEIYDGDVLRVLYTDWASKDENDTRTLEQYLIDISSVGYVAWNSHSTGWVVRMKSKYSVEDDGTVMSSIICGTHGFREVIGNIHTDSHLLK